MKDSAFIELLNLYLDHEISAADAAKLEAEVSNNPARRRVYQDYCRMQKACKILAKDFTDVSAPAARNVVAFESAKPTRRSGWYAAGATLAAAACVAFVVVNRSRVEMAQPKTGVAAETRENIPAPVRGVTDRTIPRTITVPAGREEPQVVHVSALSLADNNPTPPALRFVAADQTAPQFAWISSVQLAPMQRASLDEFRFDAHTPMPADNPGYTKRKPGQPPTEWIVLRWQK